MPPVSELGDLPDRIDAARSIFVLTGSGISAESGLPTFRGVGGLWRTHRVEELASPGGFAHDPRLVWTWYNERRRAHQRVEPSAAHVALAQLEARSSDFTLATQNVDSLHPEETALTAHADRSIRARASDVLPALVT
jgi:NAD-dependent deacetylase